jgi:hypothetical protein
MKKPKQPKQPKQTLNLSTQAIRALESKHLEQAQGGCACAGTLRGCY